MCITNNSNIKTGVITKIKVTFRAIEETFRITELTFRAIEVTFRAIEVTFRANSAVLQHQAILVEGMGQVLRPLNPGE